MIKKLKKFFVDRCFAQAFEEAGIKKEEFSDACKKLSLQPCVTSPTGAKEYSDAKISCNLSLGSETWDVVKSNASQTYTKGENEAVAVAKTENDSFIGTFDKSATNKCKSFGINCIDHITFLLAMVEVGTIDIVKAESIYKKWGTNIPPGNPQTLVRYVSQNKLTIDNKLKLLNIKYV